MGLTPRGLFSGGVITGIFFFCLMVHDGPITGGGGGGLISGILQCLLTVEVTSPISIFGLGERLHSG